MSAKSFCNCRVCRTLLVVFVTSGSLPSLAQLPLADFNADGAVEFIDLQILNVNLNLVDATFEQGDLNGDGFVNVFDVMGFDSQMREGLGDGTPAASPPGNELSLIVDSIGNMWAWGLLKEHPRDRVLLMGYSLRSKAGNLSLDKHGRPILGGTHVASEFERVSAGAPRFRIDGARILQAKYVSDDPIDLADLSFRYGTADGVFESLVHPGIPGDADLDGRVSFQDFVLLSTKFGTDGGWGDGDFDHDNKVAFPDFTVLATNFGQQLPGFNGVFPAVAVPEIHNSLSLLLFLAVLHILVRTTRLPGMTRS